MPPLQQLLCCIAPLHAVAGADCSGCARSGHVGSTASTSGAQQAATTHR